MGVSGFFGKHNISKIDIRPDLPEEIYANTEIPLKVTLINSRRFLPAFLIRVKIMEHEVLFPFVDKNDRDVKYLNVAFSERGTKDIGNIIVSSVFPFNFFVRSRKIPGTSQVTVFPQAVKCEWQSFHERDRKTRGEKPVDKSGYDTDILSLRKYSYGDPLKYIHWKASAKTGRLTTKEMSSLSNQPVVIDIEALPAKNIEERLSFAVYLVLKLLKKNIPVGIKIAGTTYGPDLTHSHKIAMMKRLALYGKE